ncbi:Tip elongation aberrant protein 3 [Trachymyrmex zeteki]|uniref:Tip elongation aberrant protein 3 n=1 Tax=Mycetomoellerius zeteki TaxID=64791 RepID=A0A151WP38_9HYME|nr:Tip elongation aberrant protein 3 [Trachymyrmex zeteki]
MWSSVTAAGTENGPAPPSRSKHSATLLAGHVYLLGGRNGNLPLKDLWRYSLAESKWEELHPGGERPPALQEHSAVAYKDCLYVFGGELGFSAGTETPLWVYNVKPASYYIEKTLNDLPYDEGSFVEKAARARDENVSLSLASAVTQRDDFSSG